MYKLDKGDKDAIRLTRATIGPHSAEVLKKMLIKEGNSRIKKEQAAEERSEGDTENPNNCGVCNVAFPFTDCVNEHEEDKGVQCYYCSNMICQSCIDSDAAHAIGEYDLEVETVCKTCCERQVKLRNDREQAAEDSSIEAAEDHPG